MVVINASKQNYIILAKNVIPDDNINSNNIYIRATVLHESGSSDIALNTFLRTQYSNNHKHRLILSQTMYNKEAQTRIYEQTCFITQNNMKNNIKFIHNHNNNRSTSKILFVKNQNIADNSYNYLVRTATNPTTTLSNFFHLNYYFNSSKNNDYFNINLKDFIYKDLSVNNLIDYANIRYSIKDISSIGKFENISAAQSIINYRSFDFSSLFIDNKTSFIQPDTSLNKLILDTSYSIYNNIYSYNKLTLDFTNVNTYSFIMHSGYTIRGIDSDHNNNKINTFMIKTNNFEILNTIKTKSNIIFDNKNNIYLNNVKTIDISCNFYNSNSGYNKTSVNKNTIFLSLGNQITGLTQSDLYNNTHTVSSNNTNINISKIIFSKNINASLLTSNNASYNSLIPNLNKYYLLDFTYNSNNCINNINNTINLNNILFNKVEYKTNKIFGINFSNFINYDTDVCNNYFNNSTKKLLLINNKSTNIDTSLNNALNFKLKDINYDNTSIQFQSFRELRDGIFGLTPFVNYDVRYNYGMTFYINLNLDILLNNTILDLCNSLPFNKLYGVSYVSEVNFYSLQITNIFTTSVGSDFDNVDCIYVYHNPATETDPSFLYPYSNIEIRRSGLIDSLEKAIVLLPGEATSTTNSAFIPARNGSNLSRKMIQGLVGLNNIPKLLSIKPYDTNFINGRGFINQYQIENTCNNNEDKVKNKLNSIAHYSVKDNSIFQPTTLRNQNFADIVRSNARNRLSQSCVVDYANVNVVTPFKLSYFRK